jgi:hypothetical protein
MDDKQNSQSPSLSTRGPASPRKPTKTLVALNFQVPFEFRQRLKLAAASRGVTMTALVIAALDNYLTS